MDQWVCYAGGCGFINREASTFCNKCGNKHLPLEQIIRRPAGLELTRTAPTNDGKVWLCSCTCPNEAHDNHCWACKKPRPLTRSAQREAGEKHRMRLHQPQREIAKDQYAEAILTQMDALRLIMSRRFDPDIVQMIAKEALNTLYALGK